MHKLVTKIIVILIFCAGEIATGQSTNNYVNFGNSSTERQAQSADLVDQAISLLKEYFAAQLNEEELFKQASTALSCVIPPWCSEKIESGRHATASERQKFKNQAQQAARLCSRNYEKLVIFALNSVLARIDANTSILDVDAMREIKIGTSGKFGGVGMIVDSQNGEYRVVSALEGSPAQKVGIKPGFEVLEIDNQAVHGLPLLDVLKKVRGPVGSIMDLKLLDGGTGKTLHFRIRRQMIQIPSVRWAILDKDIGYLRIVNFQNNCGKEAAKALMEMGGVLKENVAGLILDLRDNPGGVFGEAIRIANLFISSGRITSIVAGNPKLNKEINAEGISDMDDIPIVILINKGSASASEVLTGALQGRPNVVVLGKPSFGKASVQGVFPLKNGMAARITTAHYFTADGRNIEGKGLEPDIDLTYTEENMYELLESGKLSEDSGIRAAVQVLRNGMVSHTPFDTLF